MNVIVVGSGLAAVGAIRALLRQGHRPTVLDIGERPPATIVDTQTVMASRPPDAWTSDERQRLAANESASGRGVPRKLVFGSDYFYSAEQTEASVNGAFRPGTPPWSPARGGFSVGWGAAVLPPAPSDIADWPIGHDELLLHMRAALGDIPVSEPDDELSEVFGKLCLDRREPLGLSRGQQRLLEKLREAAGANATGRQSAAQVLVGQSRLLTQTQADAATRCRLCGYCSSGCVYGSIYTAEHDIDRWIPEDRIDYRAGSTVFLVRETAREVEVCFTRHGQVESLRADRVLLAAGAVNSTRVLLNSAPVHLDTATIRRTGYAVQIFGSTEALEVEWPSVNTQTSHFVALKDEGISPYWAHVQVGQPNELVLQRLGLTQANLRSVRGRFVKAAAGHLVSVALNAHSSCGPTYEVRVQRNDAGLPKMETSQRWSDASRRAVAMYGGLLARSLRRGGLYRVPFAKQDSGSALTYHFGASFPMTRQPRAPHDTDVLGRPFGWQRVHVVDTSVLPAIPATTVGVVTMANAHRVATAMSADEQR